MPRLVLIDGSSYLYRAFHALPPLSNDAGEPTGALFGVVNMLRATLKEQPECVAFVVDAPGPTFREALDPQYKANRPPMPDELRTQVQPMCEIVEALGIPILRVEGVEADDVIGTLALQAAAEGVEVAISTSDKDFAQLVRDDGAGRVALVNTMSGSRLDSEQAVVDKFGVPPARIVDYLALVGDKIDNIPGVDKCGPKTAAKWLGEHGDLDGVIAHADAVGGKLGENLRAVLGRLPLNRELATIRTDLALDRRHDQLRLRERDADALRALYARYGFRQALRELEGGSADAAAGEVEAAATGAGMRSTPAGYARAATAPAPGVDPALAAPGEYEMVLDMASLRAWIGRVRDAGCFAFDTETDSLDPMRANLVGLSLCVEPGRACYIPVGHAYPGAPAQLDRQAVLDALRPLLQDPQLPKVGQHGKYDLHVLRRHGVEVAGYADDTMLESFVLNATATRHDMDSLAQRYLGYTTVKFADVAGKGAKAIGFEQVALDDATRYAAEDADVTLRLHRVLAPRLAAEPTLERVYRDIEMPLVPVLARVEANGVLVDAARVAPPVRGPGQAHAGRQPPRHRTRRPRIQPRLAEAAVRAAVRGTRPAGAGEDAEGPALHQRGGAGGDRGPARTAARDPRVPRPAKLRSTYTDKLPEMVNPDTGRVHTSYHQAGAATGRLASSDPNLQNIPIRTVDGRRIRTAFVAPEGRRIVACDYSQIELRIMAHLSGDPGLVDAFAAGADIHRATAAEVFGKPIDAVGPDERRAAKAINFGLMYGMGPHGLARQLGIARTEAQDYIALYFSRYPGVRDFMERTREQARERGYVETVFGRRLYLDNIHARNQGLRAGAERAAINAPMQGTAADIIKRAMVDIDGWLAGHRGRAQMVMQVHDELVFEAEAGFAEELVAEVGRRMAAAAELRVPLVVDSGVGANWDEAH
jgi:DNA polymerase I